MSNNKLLTTNKLIKSITDRALIPTTNVTFQEPEYLAFINEEMDLGVVPHIMMYHEDYLLVHEDIPLSNGVDRYSIPSRAIGTKLRDVVYSSGGDNYCELTRISIEDIAEKYNVFSYYNNLMAFYIEGDEVVIAKSNAIDGAKLRVAYYLRPNAMVSESDVSVVTNINRNNGLVTVDKYPDVFLNKTKFDIVSSKSSFRPVAIDITPDGVVSDINLNFTFGTQKIAEYVFPTIGSIPNASYLKIIDSSESASQTNIFWFDMLGTNVPPVVSGNLYRVNCAAALTTEDVIDTLVSVFNSSFVDNRLIMSKLNTTTAQITNGGVGVSVGDNFTTTSVNVTITETVIQQGTVTIPKKLNIDDVISLPEQTTIPQIPIELHPMLAQRCAMRCLEAMGDNAGLQAAQLKLQDMEFKTGTLIDNRVESSPRKVNPRHSPIKRATRIYGR